MSKEEFMKELEKSIGLIDEEEKKDILYDYEEHFTIGFEKGKTEEEIIKELGDPKIIGKSYRAYSAVNEASENPSNKNLSKSILTAIALIMFNLIIVIGPFLGIVGALLGLVASSFAVFISGIAIVISVIFKPFLASYITFSLNPIAALFFGIGSSALGILLFIGFCYTAKIFYKLILRYLRWNLDTIKN